ncbi:MAG: hypothetical protein PF588_09145, partial [Candidatus Kapabacteria bacterium]|jgi:small nuclear ribonucleoprotein (snRNP)-like protein|nr:hypothetical protein [Candidatus Kapabacteria bacterium]
VMLLPAVGQAQFMITTRNDVEYIGIISSQDKDSLKLKTLNDKLVSFSRENIQSVDTLKTRVELRDGEVYIGTIKGINEKEYVLISDNAGERKIQRDMLINLQISYIEDDFSNWAVVDKDYQLKLENKYSMFGTTLGAPGVFNFVFGYQFGKVAVRGSLGFSWFWTGAQANLMYNISKYKHFEHNLSIVSGIINRLDDEELGYIGLYYDLNYNNFFLEFGPVFLTQFGHPYQQIVPMASVGYVHRFND